MVQLTISRKLAILSDAAKYDASCASSGTVRRDSTKTGGIGSTEGAICHSYAPDGRCIEAADWSPGGLTDDAGLRGKIVSKQLELF